MSSAILYHGPGAASAALAHAHRIGRLIAPPFGAEGLRVADTRLLASLLNSTPVGNALGVVIAGPLDHAKSIKALDALLKSIEEFDSSVQPILWAYDLDNIRPTVKSRCLSFWAPSLDVEVDEALEAAGRNLVAAALDKDRLYEIPTLVKQFVKTHQEHELLAVAAEALSETSAPTAARLWEQIRKIVEFTNPTAIEIVAAFLPDNP